MFHLGSKSIDNLLTCHMSIRVVINAAIKHSLIDFSVICGYRNEATQTKVFNNGKSKARWLESPHNYDKSLAVDLYPYPVDWVNVEPFHYLAGLVTGIGHAHGIPITWGGSWKTFKDLPHFELTNWKELRDEHA